MIDIETIRNCKYKEVKYGCSRNTEMAQCL